VPKLQPKLNEYATVFQTTFNMARQNARVYDTYFSRVALIGDIGSSGRCVP